MKTAVLMFHAVGSTSATGADPHYAVSENMFDRQLQTIRQSGLMAASVKSIATDETNARHGTSATHGVGLARVALTFDDGHETNYEAAGKLIDAGMSADFFVNPSTVGQKGFLSWDALDDMQRGGMSIQSHGMTHRYLNDMDAGDALNEMLESRLEIESRLGTSCDLFAPPGGRVPAGFLELLRQAGYKSACTSRPGYWHPARSTISIPRLAILSSTDLSTFRQWITGSRVALVKIQARAAMLGSLKSVIGNEKYDRLRDRLLG